MRKHYSNLAAAALLSLSLLSGSTAHAANPLIISNQGSFAIGGTVIQSPGAFDPQKPFDPTGQTLHGDHAYVSYQIPDKNRTYPLIFLHGAGQFSKTWGTTPDGREGFQNIFLRRGYSTYLIDQPRRGNAGRSTVPGTIPATTDDQLWFGMFRVGNWPDFYPNVQFPHDQESLNQYFRQMTPNTGPYDAEIISDALAALFTKTGPGIMVTHSQGGGPGWLTAIKNSNVKAIVAYEPGSHFVFPASQVPAPLPSATGPLAGVGIPDADFDKLTKIPIIIYYGDNIPATPSDNPAQDNWRVRLEMARTWAAAVNSRGGDVTVVHLPETGIYGNTHFPFSDLNNIQIADLLEQWLHAKGLDKYK